MQATSRAVMAAGGIAGVAAGITGSQFEIVGVTPVIQPYPANRAAALRPIDALRYE